MLLFNHQQLQLLLFLLQQLSLNLTHINFLPTLHNTAFFFNFSARPH
jgi:hypothetical protein